MTRHVARDIGDARDDQPLAHCQWHWHVLDYGSRPKQRIYTSCGHNSAEIPLVRCLMVGCAAVLCCARATEHATLQHCHDRTEIYNT